MKHEELLLIYKITIIIIIQFKRLSKYINYILMQSYNIITNANKN